MSDEEDPRLTAGAKELGAHLRRIRQDRDLLLREVAARLGPNDPNGVYLSEIERGAKLPSLTYLLRLADVYDVLVVELLVDRFPWGRRTPPAD